MKHSTAAVAARLTLDEFPRSARYDPLWMLENLMGPNPLWLAESLSLIPNGWKHWLRWLEVCQDEGFPAPPEEIDMLRSDAGRTLGFTRVVARRRA